MTARGWRRLVIDQVALHHNMSCFRTHIPAASKLMAVVKANGYGHGLLPAARAFLAGGADWLGVHTLDEAEELRRQGVDAPIVVLGPSTSVEVQTAAALNVDITVPSLELARSAVAGLTDKGPEACIHLKVETGVNRQGIVEAELDDILAVLKGSPRIRINGLSSHFANIEDTTDHGFAHSQRERFETWTSLLAGHGHADLIRHMSCSAAAVLWPDAPLDMVRIGVSAYGVWPSRETLVSAGAAGFGDLDLRTAMSWRVDVSQVRTVPAGETVGYGRAWKAPIESRIAVLPVGYADGYLRALSGNAHVLLHGRRAPLVGRVCMNLCMADVTHIPEAQAGDEAVLLGSQGDELITTEHMASWLGTIPYEVLTLPGETWNRILED